MIQPLRTAHRTIFLGLGILLPVLLIAGISSRSKNVVMPVATQDLPQAGAVFGQQTISLGGQKIEVRIAKIQSAAGATQFQLVPSAPLVAPDLLLYWTAESAASLPNNATLIRAYNSQQPFSVPPARAANEFLLLYDLPHQRVIATFPLGDRR